MNVEQVKSLTDDHLRLKVAELCGWGKYSEEGFYFWKAPDGTLTSVEYEQFMDVRDDPADWPFIPDYPNDLNACHEMEKKLSGDNFYHYYALLAQSCLDGEIPHMASAPARLRCEAFVLTLG